MPSRLPLLLLSGVSCTWGEPSVPEAPSPWRMLEALGYADPSTVAGPEGPCGVIQPAEAGVAVPVLEVATPGAPIVRLDADGRTEALPGEGERFDRHTVRMAWRPDGSRAVLDGSGRVSVLGPDGALRWRHEAHLHHDVVARPDGGLIVIDASIKEVEGPEGPLRVVDDEVVWLSADGAVQARASVTDALLGEVTPRQWRRAYADDMSEQALLRGGTGDRDLLHTNGLDRVAGRIPACRDDDVVVLARNLETLACLGRDEVVSWRWSGSLELPHDPVVLPDGRIQVFDNGVRRGASRVVLVEPETGRWTRADPQADPYLSTVLGQASAPTAEGHRLLVVSTDGELRWVDGTGRSLWRWRACREDGTGTRIHYAAIARDPSPISPPASEAAAPSGTR